MNLVIYFFIRPKADEYARALQGGHLVDDPNFIVNSLSPKIFVRNNNDED